MTDLTVTSNSTTDDFIENLLEGVPDIVAVLLVLLVGFILASVVKTIVSKALRRASFDQMIASNSFGKYVAQMLNSPTRFIAKSAYWLIGFATVTSALAIFEINTFDRILTGIYGYIPNIIAAMLIFAGATGLSALVGGAVQRTMGNTATGKVVQSVVPAIIMSISIFMILNQLNIAPEIVTITYAAIMGSLALGLALAFGLGGRDVAAKMLESAYASGQRNMEQVKKDVKTGKKAAKKEVNKRK